MAKKREGFISQITDPLNDLIRKWLYAVASRDILVACPPRESGWSVRWCQVSVAVLVSGTGFWSAAAGRGPIKMETNEVGRNEVLRWGRTRSLIYSPAPLRPLLQPLSFFDVLFSFPLVTLLFILDSLCTSCPSTSRSPLTLVLLPLVVVTLLFGLHFSSWLFALLSLRSVKPHLCRDTFSTRFSLIRNSFVSLIISAIRNSDNL